MNIAVGLYETKHGTDAILFATLAKTPGELPAMTNTILESVGVCEPDIEGDDAAETFTWENVVSVGDLPILKIPQPRKKKRCS